MDWWLFVDESGDFRGANKDVLMAGLLLPMIEGAAGLPHPHVLRGAIRGLAPDLPYPLHAAHLRQELLLPFAALAARRTAAGSVTKAVEELGRVADEVFEALGRNPHDARERDGCIAALARSQLPRWGTLRLLGGRLNALDRRLWQRCVRLQRELDARLVRLLRMLRADLDQARKPGLPLIIAAEASCGAAYGGAQYPEGERWWTLLRTCLIRLLQVLQLNHAAEDHHVWPAFDAMPFRGDWLRPRDVTAIWREIPEPLRKNVRLEQVAIAGKDSKTPPGLVLVDFAANRSLSFTSRLGKALKHVESGIAQIGVCVRSGPEIDTRSHLSAYGEPKTKEGWPREQAAEWERT